MADSEFQLPPDLFSPQRAVQTATRGNLAGWFFSKSDGFLGVPVQGDNAVVFWGIASLLALGFSWSAWKFTISLGRSWANYTKGRIAPGTIAGNIMAAIPATVATLLTGYCFYRLRRASAAPSSVESIPGQPSTPRTPR